MTDLIEILLKARDARIVAKRSPAAMKRGGPIWNAESIIRDQVRDRDRDMAEFIRHCFSRPHLPIRDYDGRTIQGRRMRLAYLLAYRALVPHYEVRKRRWPVSYGLREVAE